MKSIKNLFILLLVTLMMSMLTVGVFADATNNNTPAGFYSKNTEVFTFEILDSDMTHDHELYVYQVLKGDLNVTQNGNDKSFIMSNIEAGNNLDFDKLKTNLANSNLATHYADVTTPKGFAEKLSTSSHEQQVAKILSESLKDGVNGVALTKVPNADGTATYKLSGNTKLAPGYYLVVDKGHLDIGVGASRFIATVVGDVSTAVKAQAVPTISKYVVDNNDSVTPGALVKLDTNTGYEGLKNATWRSAADHDINDIFMQRVEAKLPSAGYNDAKYIFKIIDELFAGLTIVDKNGTTLVVTIPAGYPTEATATYTDKLNWINNNTLNSHAIKLFVDGTQTIIVPKAVYDDFKAVAKPVDQAKHDIETMMYYSYDDTTKKLVVGSDDIKASIAPNGSESIEVFYNVKFNDNVIVGYNKDANGIKGNYNSVYLEYQGDGNVGTTEKDYTTVFTWEVDLNKIDSKTKQALAGAEFKLKKLTGTNPEAWEEITPVLEQGSTNRFKIVGLDDGYYKLEETKVPNGYNKLDDMYFKIVAGHTIAATETPDMTFTNNLIDLSVVRTDKNWNDLKDKDGNTIKASDTSNNGVVVVDVENEKGITLPSTGGIGTTIFYVAGGLLVLGSAAALVVKKKN